MRTLVLALLIVACEWPLAASAFEVEGFRSGMTKSDVEAKLRSWQRVSEVEPGTLVATDQFGNTSSFNFCEGKLVSMQQNLKPSLRQFVAIMRDFNSRHGQPFSSVAGSRAHQTGQVNELSIWWRYGGEFVSVYYMGSSLGESLSTSHQVPNSCFKVPR
jgi:hypothetical protein